jgi:phage terminase large subunit
MAAAVLDPLLSSPGYFAKKVLGLGLYEWQEDVLNWFEDTTRLVKGSLCTPNGAGKSERIVATLALWWITVHPKGVVVITTKDSKQLDNQIWPAIERQKGKFAKYDFIERMVRNGLGGFIIGFTTDDPGRAEGWHKLDNIDGPLLIIGDEAKSIADPIHMALDRCTYNAKLLTSSPGLTEGLFWRSQTDPKMGFQRKRVGLVECPHIPKERIDNIISTYGADHWFTRSTLYAEFTDSDSETLFIVPKDCVRNAMDFPPSYVHGGKRAFCDFAAGGNENVFALKEGNRISLTCWRDPDPMRAIARFVMLFVEHGLSPSEISGDEGGMGIPIIARFRELGWPINAVNNDAKAFDPRYSNLGAEMWWKGSLTLQRGNIILPKDDILFTQLTRVRADASSDGELGKETKKDMAKRGIPSPDRGDAVMGVLAADAELIGTFFDETGLKKMEAAARASHPVEGSLDLAESAAVRFTQGAQGSWLKVWERPVVGRSYLVVANPAPHSEPLGDHTILVVRTAFEKEPARLVAKVRRPLKLDAGPLARLVRALSGWYGGALVVPVVRPHHERGDVIDKLVETGMALYVREDFEVLNHGRGERLRYGWESDTYSRSQWIGELSEVIRQDGLIAEDVDAVIELFQLSAQNADRLRDAESLGVAMKLRGYSSLYLGITSGRQVSEWGPQDLGRDATPPSMIS